MKALLKFLLATTLIAMTAGAAQSDDFEQAHDVMKEIAIKHITSDDRNLPKKDQLEWERRFSDYVDFDAFNANMRTRVRDAAEALDAEEKMTRENVRALEDKAVLFLVPRTLFDSTLAFLRAADRLEEIDVCKPEAAPGDAIVMCTDAVSADELHVRVVASGQSGAFRFRRTDRLRLIDIDVPVTEKVLVRLAYWK